jgi:hypothetical protein
MCRSIAQLRGLEPPATPDEVEAAARQFLAKVAGLSAAQRRRPEVEAAVGEVAGVVTALLAALPAGRGAPGAGPSSRLRGPAAS